MFILLDIVPNHMGVGGADNPWWLSLLEWGEMSPLAARIRHSADAASRWRASVVRMNTSLLTPIASTMRRNRPETSSAKSLGDNPASRAAFSTFWPCSSVPVRNSTCSPSKRWNRAIMSAAIAV